jgi:hypothetical protein
MRSSCARDRRRCAAPRDRPGDRGRPGGSRPARGRVQIVPTADREAVGDDARGPGGTIDLIIPRGGRALVERVSKDARVPVLGHLEGVCHTYVHASADPDMAAEIVAMPSCAGYLCLRRDRDFADRPGVAPALLPLHRRGARGLRACAATRLAGRSCPMAALRRIRLAHRISGADPGGAKTVDGPTRRSRISPALAPAIPRRSSPRTPRRPNISSPRRQRDRHLERLDPVRRRRRVRLRRRNRNRHRQAARRGPVGPSS